MITLFNFETNHLYGDVLPQLFKFRHDEFVLRQNYQVPTFNNMEYDQYDTPAAVYIIWRDAEQTIRAGMRILPTNRPYMIEEIWPETVSHVDLPKNPAVWEATRFFIDRTMDQKLRHQAHGEILCAMLEFALKNGVTDFIATAPPNLWQHTFRKCGWPATPVGESTEIAGFSSKILTCMMDVSEDILDNVRLVMGIRGSVIANADMMEKPELFIDMRAARTCVCQPTRKSLAQVKANGTGLHALDKIGG